MKYIKYNNTQCLCDLFYFLSKKNITYCVVGNTIDLPDKISSDIDIVISGEHMASVSEIIYQFSQEVSSQLVQVLQHEQTAYYFILSLINDNDQVEYLHPDICGDYLRNGRLFLKATDLLQNRKLATTDQGIEKPFYVPSPEMEFIYYLMKKIDKKSIDLEQWEHLLVQYQQAPECCLKQAHKIWSTAQAARVIACFQSGNFNEMQKLLPEVQKELSGNHRPSLKYRWREFKRKVYRVLQPTGVTVVLLGPDGAGKTAIGDGLIPIILPAFRGQKRFHLRPSCLGRKSTVNSNPVTDPHGKAPRGFLASLAKLAYFWLDYTLGYWLQVRPLKVRSNFILFDRYYHDLMIDPKRYRHNGPAWLTRLVGRVLPGPDLFIVLDAPAEIIHERKQEVPLEETQRQREAYLQFAKETPSAIVLNTDQSLEATVNEGVLAVLQYMEKRQRARMGLNDAK